MCCTGYVFWHLVNSQYFPSAADLEAFPDFRKGHLSSSEVSEVLEDWNPSGTGLVDSLLEEVVIRLSINRLQVESMKSELLENINSKASKDQFDTVGKTVKRGKDQSPEERFLLGDLRLLGLRPVYEDYFKYIEAKQRSGSGDMLQSAAIGSSLSVRVSQLPKCEDEYACAVCSDGDYEDDNLIVICAVSSTQTCEVAVHMKCYGVQVLPNGDWICTMCAAYGKETSKSMPCALCSVPGGALKPTVHHNTGKNYPYYPVFDKTLPASLDNPEFVWCHVYCALRVPGVALGNEGTMTDIDLSRVDPERFRRRCNVCCTDHGACLTCQHRKCDFSFHPECGKELLVPWKKFGLEETDVYCLNHRPIKLGKMIENRDKKKVEDVVNFAKLWEKWETRPTPSQAYKAKAQPDKAWTFEESEQLEREVYRFLRRMNERQTKPFDIVINLRSASRSGAVHLSTPEVYNYLSPEAIITEKISIRNRSPQECFNYYQAKLMQRMKLELDLCKSPAKVFIPSKRRRSNVERRVEPIKRPKKRLPCHKDPSSYRPTPWCDPFKPQLST